MTATETKRLLDNPSALADFLATIHLDKGSHGEEFKGHGCVMEVVAHVAGEPFSDHPKCASKTITTIAIRLNDRWNDDDRQRLKPFIVRIAGTAADEATELKRAWMCADWAIRTAAPLWLERAGLTEGAAELRALPEVAPETHETAKALARTWREKAWRLRDERWKAFRKKYPAAYADAYADAYAYAADAAAAAYAAAYAAAAAAAYAAAAADAYAAAYADAYAYADADAYADAYADADAGLAYGSPGWKKLYDATHKAVTEKLAPIRAESVTLALGLLEKLIQVTEAPRG